MRTTSKVLLSMPISCLLTVLSFTATPCTRLQLYGRKLPRGLVGVYSAAHHLRGEAGSLVYTAEQSAGNSYAQTRFLFRFTNAALNHGRPLWAVGTRFTPPFSFAVDGGTMAASRRGFTSRAKSSWSEYRADGAVISVPRVHWQCIERQGTVAPLVSHVSRPTRAPSRSPTAAPTAVPTPIPSCGTGWLELRATGDTALRGLAAPSRDGKAEAVVSGALGRYAQRLFNASSAAVGSGVASKETVGGLYRGPAFLAPGDWDW